MTMTLVNTVTIGAGGAAVVVFADIPQTGTDLILQVSSRDSSGSTQYAYLNFSGSGANFSSRDWYGTGSVAGTGTRSDNIIQGMSNLASTANTFNNATLYIPNYSTTGVKLFQFDSVIENNGTVANQRILAGRCTDTGAITSLSLATEFGSTFVQGSAFSLYTITKGSGGATVA